MFNKLKRPFKDFLELIESLKTETKFSPSDPLRFTSIRYLNGHEVLDRDPERFRRALMIQGISEDQIKFGQHLQFTNELRIIDNKVVEVIEHCADQAESVGQNVEYDLPIEDWPDHKYFFLIPDKGGPHQIGGECPKPIVFDSQYGFSFIASIDGTDPFFSWVETDELNIFYPLNTCCLSGLFIDWKNEKEPIVLNPEVMTDAWRTNYVDGSEVGVFKGINYKSTDDVDVNLLKDEFGDTHICGVPMWYQAPDIPVYPKTGNVMRYVTTIKSNVKNELIEGTSVFGDYLTFMDVGFLYVFWEPTSNIMYLTAQC